MATILLYGATGFSGKLIAQELAERDAECRLLLAGRDAGRLRELAEELDVEYRAFGLDRRGEVRKGLRDVDVVLNAAGPFAYTAERLAKVALEVGCHYVDVNGEADVYQRLDDLSLHARQRKLKMVCGAGFWSAASNVLLNSALDEIAPPAAAQDRAQPDQPVAPIEIGTVRIAMSRINTFSRGSVATVWRSLREQVLVVRRGEELDRKGTMKPQMVIRHEPVGKLEHRFDFRPDDSVAPDIRVGSAVSLVDTLAARITLQRRHFMADGIESYVEMDDGRRVCYQLGSMMAPVAATRMFRTLVQQPIEMLAPGPEAYEREEEPHVILLEIDDRFRAPLIRWRWQTPNVYQFTAQLASEVALQVSNTPDDGWLTPAEALQGVRLDFGAAAGPNHDGPLRESRLQKRST